jgi:hypothetical protein
MWIVWTGKLEKFRPLDKVIGERRESRLRSKRNWPHIFEVIKTCPDWGIRP